MNIKHLLGVIIIMAFYSCQKADLSPVTGTYTGQTIIEKFGFEELKDSAGNFVGVVQTRDTIVSEGDMFSVAQVKKKALFTVSSVGELSLVNNFSGHEFTYGESQEFIVSQIEDQFNRTLEFSFDGAGNVTLSFTEEALNADNRPPVGQEVKFVGAR